MTTTPLRDRRTGRFTKAFTISFHNSDGRQTRTVTERGVATIGRILNRQADRGDVWGIAVTNQHGDDVTFNFPVFT